MCAYHFHREIVCYHDSLYFAVITLTTVGFGDYSPVTTVGRLLSSCTMIVGLGICTTQITKMGVLLAKVMPYGKRYRPLKHVEHVIMVGHLHHETVQAFLARPEARRAKPVVSIGF